MNRKTLGVLLCSVSYFFATEYSNPKHFDVFDSEVEYYMGGNAVVSYEEYCQQAQKPLSNKPINTVPAWAEAKSDKQANNGVAAVDAFAMIDRQALDYIASGNIELAVSVYDNALQDKGIKPQQAEYCRNKKNDLLSQYILSLYMQDIHEATQFLNKDAAFNTLTTPQKTSILCDASKSLCQDGKHTEAIDAVCFAINLDEKKYVLRLQLITVLKEQKNYNTVFLQYEHALKTCKRTVSQLFFAHMDMASIYYKQYKNTDMARESLKIAKGVYGQVAKCQQLKYDALQSLVS